MAESCGQEFVLPFWNTSLDLSSDVNLLERNDKRESALEDETNNRNAKLVKQNLAKILSNNKWTTHELEKL